MCDETKKAYDRRVKLGWFDKYLVGSGIDIGCGPDKLQSPYGAKTEPNSLNPEIRYLVDAVYQPFSCRGWDTKDGDAQYLRGIADESFDFVYSSHCLEHMVDPSEALRNWWRVLRHGGFLVVVVPDAILYEQRVWPSKGNGDHKTTWELERQSTWSPVHRCPYTEVEKLTNYELISCERIDTNYDYELAKRGWIDQTGQCIGGVEAAIEFVVRKCDH
jgi:SAM-dependent methyltransferase